MLPVQPPAIEIILYIEISIISKETKERFRGKTPKAEAIRFHLLLETALGLLYDISEINANYCQ
jgi:hypothetical protein